MFFNIRRLVVWRCVLISLLSFGLISLGNAQEIVATNRATDVRAQPEDAAASLQSLPAQAKVQLLERKGAWSRVKTESQTGWVRMMHLRGGVTIEEAPPQTKSGGLLSGFNRLLGGNQGSAKAQNATLGIRGLSPEELQAAAPNPQALAKTKSFVVSKTDAEQFAKAANLAKADVADPVTENKKGARP